MRQRTIAVDFDGTISTFYNWTGPYSFGPPIEGVKEFLEAIQTRGYQILVYSCRSKNDRIADSIGAWMKEHSLPYDKIFVHGFKPDASAYIDDRAISVQPQRFGASEYDKALTELDSLLEYKKEEKLR